jgi:hypothetical protein
MIDDFADELVVNSIHVRAPTQSILLCGGQMTAIGENIPTSIRDAFYKITNFEPLKGASPLRAEDVEALHIKEAKYSDLLKFECDIAQLSKLVLLFSESFGSAAELGAFAMHSEIASKMLVVIREKHYNQTSFIKVGILESLKSEYGRESYYILDDNHVGIFGDNLSHINRDELAATLSKPVSDKLAAIDSFTTFDPKLRGHIVKLIVGFIQEFGALTFEEIITLLIAVDVDKPLAEIEQLCLCTKVMEWVDLVGKGAKDFVVAKVSEPAAEFKIVGKKLEKNPIRRRANFLENWKANDNDRFRAIIASRA